MTPPNTFVEPASAAARAGRSRRLAARSRSLAARRRSALAPRRVMRRVRRCPPAPARPRSPAAADCPRAAAAHVQQPADRRAAVAVPVPGQGAAGRQHRELLRLHQPVRGPRGAVPQVQGPRPRRLGLPVQRLRRAGARHRTRRSPSSAARPTASSSRCSRRPAAPGSPRIRFYAELIAKHRAGAAVELPQVPGRPQRPGASQSFGSAVEPGQREFVRAVERLLADKPAG